MLLCCLISVPLIKSVKLTSRPLVSKAAENTFGKCSYSVQDNGIFEIPVWGIIKGEITYEFIPRISQFSVTDCK
jgi:hypothetical protein